MLKSYHISQYRLIMNDLQKYKYTGAQILCTQIKSCI